MTFTATSILQAFKGLAVSDSPQVKRTQYLNFLAKRIGFLDYAHFCRCLHTVPSDRITHYYAGLMKKICAVRVPREDVAHVRLYDCFGLSVGYDSHFIGWDKDGREVREPRTWHHTQAIVDFRKRSGFELYVIENEDELFEWQWTWRGCAAVPVDMAKNYFSELFDLRAEVVENPPFDLIKSRAMSLQPEHSVLGMFDR